MPVPEMDLFQPWGSNTANFRRHQMQAATPPVSAGQQGEENLQYFPQPGSMPSPDVVRALERHHIGPPQLEAYHQPYSCTPPLPLPTGSRPTALYPYLGSNPMFGLGPPISSGLLGPAFLAGPPAILTQQLGQHGGHCHAPQLSPPMTPAAPALSRSGDSLGTEELETSGGNSPELSTPCGPVAEPSFPRRKRQSPKAGRGPEAGLGGRASVRNRGRAAAEGRDPDGPRSAATGAVGRRAAARGQAEGAAQQPSRQRVSFDTSDDGGATEDDSEGSRVAPRRRSTGGPGMTDEQLRDLNPSKRRRILANRQSAARSKQRKQDYVQSLELKLADMHSQLSASNATIKILRQSIEEAKQASSMYRDQVSFLMGMNNPNPSAAGAAPVPLAMQQQPFPAAQQPPRLLSPPLGLQGPRPAAAMPHGMLETSSAFPGSCIKPEPADASGNLGMALPGQQLPALMPPPGMPHMMQQQFPPNLQYSQATRGGNVRAQSSFYNMAMTSQPSSSRPN